MYEGETEVGLAELLAESSPRFPVARFFLADPLALACNMVSSEPRSTPSLRARAALAALAAATFPVAATAVALTAAAIALAAAVAAAPAAIAAIATALRDADRLRSGAR